MPDSQGAGVYSNGMEKRVGGQLSMVFFLTSEGFVSYLWSIIWNRKRIINLLLRTQKWFKKLWNFQFTDRISLIKMVSSFVRLRMCKVGSVIMALWPFLTESKICLSPVKHVYMKGWELISNTIMLNTLSNNWDGVFLQKP